MIKKSAHLFQSRKLCAETKTVLDPLSLLEPAGQPGVLRHGHAAGHLGGLPVLSAQAAVLKGRRRVVTQQVGRRGKLPLLGHHHVVWLRRQRCPANNRSGRGSRRFTHPTTAGGVGRHNVARTVVRDLLLLGRLLGLEGGEQGDGTGDLFAVLQVVGVAGGIPGLTGRNIGDGSGVQVDGAVALAGGGRLGHTPLLALARVDGAGHAARHLPPATPHQRVKAYLKHLRSTHIQHEAAKS